MRIKVDEDLPRAAAQMLRRHGHEAVSVIEQGMGGTKDDALWQAVQAEERLLVTADSLVICGFLMYPRPGIAHAKRCHSVIVSQ